jgi:hypothetical protein
MEIISQLLSDHNAAKVELNSKRNYRKHINMWILNNMLLTISSSLKKSGAKLKTSYNQIKMKTPLIRTCQIQPRQF